MSTYFEGKELNFDANAAGSTEPISSTESGRATLYVAPNTGTHDNHVFALQASPEFGAGFVTVDTITGIGEITANVVADSWRAKLITLEGAASTVDIFIWGK